jgi:hypothetical protein
MNVDGRGGFIAAVGGSVVLLRLIRLNQLIRVAAVARLQMTSPAVRLIKLGLYLLLVAHWLGCAWFLVGDLDGFADNGFSPASDERLAQVLAPLIRSPHSLICSPAHSVAHSLTSFACSSTL